MQIDLRMLSQKGTSSIPFDYTMDLSQEVVRLDKPFSNPIRVTGEITVSSGVIRFNACAHTVLTPRCDRCLKKFEKEQTVDMSFILTQDAPDPEIGENEDTVYLESNMVETDDIVYPELFLNYDMIQLCSPDCKGLCPRCGHDLNEGPCGCVKE